MRRSSHWPLCTPISISTKLSQRPVPVEHGSDHAGSVRPPEGMGFVYKSQCIWAKDKIGLGFWFRNQHEILIVAVKGDIPAPAHGTPVAECRPWPKRGSAF